MKINLPRSICPTSDEPNWLKTIETKEACKTWKRVRALTLPYSASKLRLWQLKKSKVVIVLFSFYWPKRDAAVDGWCRCTRAVYSSMWFVYYMACLPNRQCTHLLDTSWLQGCCFEILRVVSLGKFLVDLWFCWKRNFGEGSLRSLKPWYHKAIGNYPLRPEWIIESKSKIMKRKKEF